MNHLKAISLESPQTSSSTAMASSITRTKIDDRGIQLILNSWIEGLTILTIVRHLSELGYEVDPISVTHVLEENGINIASHAAVPIDNRAVSKILANWDSKWTIPTIVDDLLKEGYNTNAILVVDVLARNGIKYARSSLAKKGTLTPALKRAITVNGNSAVGRIMTYAAKKWTVAAINEELRKRGYDTSLELVRLVLEQNGVAAEEGSLLFPSFDHETRRNC